MVSGGVEETSIRPGSHRQSSVHRMCQTTSQSFRHIQSIPIFISIFSLFPYFLYFLVPVQSLMFYNGDEDYTFCRVVLSNPRLVSSLRSILENGLSVKDRKTGNLISLPSEVFESNIPFELRFMVDLSMVGCSWIEGQQMTLIN